MKTIQETSTSLTSLENAQLSHIPETRKIAFRFTTTTNLANREILYACKLCTKIAKKLGGEETLERVGQPTIQIYNTPLRTQKTTNKNPNPSNPRKILEVPIFELDQKLTLTPKKKSYRYLLNVTISLQP